MSSCLNGGSRTYAIDLEIVKSQSPSTTRTSQSSSPSSTVSESINSPLAISTRKPRTPRKRPNQTYNEAAALLSTIYPNIFSTKTLVKQPLNHTKVSEELSELLLINQQPIPEKPSIRILPKPANSSDSKPFQSPAIDYRFEEDFDAESILDEEMEEGIDSIMGNLSVNNDSYDHSIDSNYNWNPMGLGFGANFDFGFGVRAFRRVDDCDWWRFPTVDVLEISPKLNKASSEKKKKKKKKVEKREDDDEEEEQKKICSGSNIENSNSGLCLKLNYEEVLSAWSDRGSPFSEDFPGIDSSESDAIARLAGIDLFSENGGIREASVMRYREKRRNRLFSKKIRYEVRKVNADRRPRMKGRFVRRPNSALGAQDTKRK